MVSHLARARWGGVLVRLVHYRPEERAEVVAALRGSLKQSGLTQAAFARHLATSATRLSPTCPGRPSRRP